MPSSARRARLSLLPFLLLALCATVALAAPAAASAATYTVNSTGDQGDEIEGSDGCKTAENTCTLRAAIQESNFSQAVRDTISFDPSVFKGELADTIEPSTTLPPITAPVEIDGGRCPAGTAETKPCAGVNAPTGQGWIFDVEANETTIENLAVTGGTGAIDVGGTNDGASTGFVARGDWVGVKLDGSAAGSGQQGILITGSNGAEVGGTEPEQRNLIDNSPTGLAIDGAADTVVQGNWFGVNPDGTAAAVAADLDISINHIDGGGAESTEIGATISGSALSSKECDGGCNVIAGASFAGISLNNAAGPTTIHGNFVGLDPSGSTVVANSLGIRSRNAGEVTIGGSGGEADANFIVGGAEGIEQQGGVGFQVVGNRIGTGPGPVADAVSAPPSSAIFTTGVADAEPALLAENEISSSGQAITSSGRGAEILENSIASVGTALATRGDDGGAGNLIEGNTIRSSGDSFNAIQIENGSNGIFGNQIEEAGLSAIFLADVSASTAVTGNQIGGDTAESENVIRHSTFSPIALILRETTNNEVGRNRGAENGGPFILIGKSHSEDPSFPNGGIRPPTIASALPSGASGTAEPEATVRLFRESSLGDIEGFLGEAVADDSGSWKASFETAVPLGTLVTATQTLDGGSSEMGATATVAEPPPDNGGGEENGGGGDNGGGGGSGGNPPGPACPVAGSSCGGPPVCVRAAPPCAEVAPDTRITKAPKAKSRSTTAKFKFTATVKGSSFQCKLDKGKFAKCHSPKTYKHLKPGKHTFQVRAIGPTKLADKTPAKRTFKVLG